MLLLEEQMWYLCWLRERSCFVVKCVYVCLKGRLFDFKIRVKIIAQHLTGHSNLSDAACIVTVSIRELFFWSSNVIKIKSAVCKLFEECFSKEFRLKIVCF